MDIQKILVVEDSETQALRLRHILEEGGYEVDHSNRADVALNKLNEFLPDLVVTDYHLPGINGDELCRQIRLNVNTRGIPILMLTSDEDTQSEQQGLESGADDYLWKSVTDDLILIRVQALLKKSHVQTVLGQDESRFTTSRILVVDDSATYLELVAAELKEAGYQVQTATTGKDAMHKLAAEYFDAVVLDMILPDMQGIDMCRNFISINSSLERSFVLLMLTGEEDPEEMSAVLAAGADDVVGKSKDVRIIKSRLRALVRRKKLYEENQRIINEFREREAALIRAHAEKEAAEERASLADQLAQTNKELKETQAQLVQSAKMASLGELVAGVAHEINNPLAFVIIHLNTVKENFQTVLLEVESALSEKTREKINKLQTRIQDMQNGLDRIKDLVIKLRTFSRLDEGEYKQVDMVECIESVLTLLQHRIKDNVQLVKKYDKNNIIFCNPGPLNQVIMNVIANAIDALDGKGVISITTRKLESVYSISIKDNGQGIPAEILDRVCDPFFTTKPVGQGTGLGLSISYGIVKKHGGTLEIKSKPKEGAEIIISIPWQQKENKKT